MGTAFFLFHVLHWHKLWEGFLVTLNIWLGRYESSRSPYFKIITFSPEAQSRIQCVTAQKL